MVASDFLEDIPLAMAKLAHAGLSFVPSERGEQERAGYADLLASDYAALATLADTPEKRATLQVEFAFYRAGMKRRKIAQLESLSRCISAMITGPARFPTDRNRKRMDIEHRRAGEYLEFRERTLASMRKALQPELRPIMAGDDDAADRLREKIANAEKRQEFMRNCNAAIRQHAKAGPDAQVAALVALGMGAATAREILIPDCLRRIGFADYELANNNANIRRMKQRLKQVEANHAQAPATSHGRAATVEDVPAENRVRLTFPGKPSADVRTRLKSSGFRWTPSLGVWQAYRNQRTLALAAEIAEVEPCTAADSGCWSATTLN